MRGRARAPSRRVGRPRGGRAAPGILGGIPIAPAPSAGAGGKSGCYNDTASRGARGPRRAGWTSHGTAVVEERGSGLAYAVDPRARFGDRSEPPAVQPLA